MLTWSFPFAHISLPHADPVKACELFEDAVDALEIFADLCCKREPENAQIAVKNGGVEACISAHQALKTYRLSWASLSLKVLLSFLSGGCEDAKIPMFPSS